MAQSSSPQKLYSVTQIQEIFLPGLSRRQVGRLVERGDIQSYKVGKKRLISERAIQIYLSTLVPEEAEQQGRFGVGRGGFPRWGKNSKAHSSR